MESKIIENRVYIECSCGDIQHLLAFDLDEEYKSIYIQQVIPYYQTLWERIKLAFKFIQKKEWIFSVFVSENIIPRAHTDSLLPIPADGSFTQTIELNLLIT